MDKHIKILIGFDLLVWIASIIYEDFSTFKLILVAEFGIIVVVLFVKLLIRITDSDDVLTVEPLPDNYVQVDPPFSASSQEEKGFTVQPIPPIPGTAIKVDSSGMKIIDPRDLIPDVVCCSVCGKNLLNTRNEFGGVLECPHADCGYWYHKNHFYDTAGGKCFSPSCRERE